ncbi:MAG: DUF1538 domain-containing protein [Oligoflexus sp.]
MIGLRESLDLLLPYLRRRLLEQVRAVAFIITYLILFQIWVLKIAITDAATIAGGMALVILGLAFFIEGLKVGLMPLGESLGLKLPRRTPLIGLLIFALILGIGATFAEPAIGVLRAAGSSVKAWEAPLLFNLLNYHADYLVYAVGIGVGIAVVLGMLRFLYNWSLKPLLYILVPLVIALSAYCFLDDNLTQILGLAWDCGAVTTGPVTVPLVLALGIGISRVVAGHTDEGVASGFGVVTLASLMPIITVLSLGIYLRDSVPQPMPQEQFFSLAERERALRLFPSDKDMLAYTLQEAQPSAWMSYFGDEQAFLAGMKKLLEDEAYLSSSLGTKLAKDDLLRLLLEKGDHQLHVSLFPSLATIRDARLSSQQGTAEKPENRLQKIKASFLGASQAILPLTLFLLVVYRLFLRERFSQADEIFFGIALALIGMSIFFLGIELGLSKLGNQVGGRLPAAYTAVELVEQETAIDGFDKDILQSAIRKDGKVEQFFYLPDGNDYRVILYDENYLNELTGQYRFVPTHGPIFSAYGEVSGMIVILLFAFFMGYGATLAEPALNTLGSTVEDLTVGTFKKNLLIQTVGVGVGLGISLGVAKIIWDLPLFWMLMPPYLLLLFISSFSSEQFVNIGWDSAGVTTGPITVPLVLAMGLGISQQSGVVEGFGILAMASVAPILAVLLVGLHVNRRQLRILNDA